MVSFNTFLVAWLYNYASFLCIFKSHLSKLVKVVKNIGKKSKKHDSVIVFHYFFTSYNANSTCSASTSWILLVLVELILFDRFQPILYQK